MSNRVKIKRKKHNNKRIPKYTNSETVNKAIKELFDKLNIKDQDTQKLAIKIIKFVIVGGIATIISGVVFFLCDYFLKTSVLISNTIAFIISVIYNYWASCKYVFEVNKEKKCYKKIYRIYRICVNGILLSTITIMDNG